MKDRDNLSHLPESVEMLACEWLAKLDRGNLSESEKSDLSEWLKDPKNRQFLASEIAEWSDMDVLSELTHLDMGVRRANWVDHFNSFFDWKKPALYVSSLVIFALVGLVFVGFGLEPLGDSKTQKLEARVDADIDIDIDISTSVGEQVSEALPDGSVVHVNTTSVAEVSYTQDQRSVELKTGEAFFDVAPDTARPFVVYAGATSVRAIGTAFAVHLQDGAVRVSVTEGTVEFTSGGSTQLVSADLSSEGSHSAEAALGNVATYSGDQTSIDIQPAEALARQFAWQGGMLEFKGDPLSQIVEEVGRYTDARIEILDEDIKDVRLGGYFRIGDIESLSSALELGFNIRLDVVSDELIQIYRDSEI